jgi:hypothetical protein
VLRYVYDSMLYDGPTHTFTAVSKKLVEMSYDIIQERATFTSTSQHHSVDEEEIITILSDPYPAALQQRIDFRELLDSLTTAMDEFDMNRYSGVPVIRDLQGGGRGATRTLWGPLGPLQPEERENVSCQGADVIGLDVPMMIQITAARAAEARESSGSFGRAVGAVGEGVVDAGKAVGGVFVGAARGFGSFFSGLLNTKEQNMPELVAF